MRFAFSGGARRSPAARESFQILGRLDAVKIGGDLEEVRARVDIERAVEERERQAQADHAREQDAARGRVDDRGRPGANADRGEEREDALYERDLDAGRAREDPGAWHLAGVSAGRGPEAESRRERARRADGARGRRKEEVRGHERAWEYASTHEHHAPSHRSLLEKRVSARGLGEREHRGQRRWEP